MYNQKDTTMKKILMVVMLCFWGVGTMLGQLIKTNLIDTAACEGVDVRFVVSTWTVVDTIHWQVDMNDGNGFKSVVGAQYADTTTGTLKIIAPTTSMNNYKYRCVLHDEGADSITKEAILTVYPKPSQPTVTVLGPTTFCEGGNVTLLSSANNGYDWSPVVGTNQYLNVTSAGSYSVVVLDSHLCRSDPSSPVSVTVTTTPVPSSVTTDSVCNSGSLHLAAAGTGTIRWYNDPYTSVFSAGNTFNTPVISVSTIYYASNTFGGCTSARVPVLAKVNAIPSVPVAIGDSRCGPGNVTISASGAGAGEDYNWYTTNVPSPSLHSGASHLASGLSSTATYYVSKFNTITLCESSLAAVVATVKTIPSAPTTVGNSRCDAGTVALSVSSPADAFNWYVDGSTSTILSTGNSYITPSISSNTTYYVEAVTNGCPSARSSVLATVNTTPAVPVPASGSRCNAGIVSLSVSGTGTFNWYADLSTITISHTGASYTTSVISVDTTYFVSATSNGCTSDRVPVLAKVNTVPSSPVAIDNSRCGAGDVTISAGGAGAGEDYNWYDGPASSPSLHSGASYLASGLSSTTTYYVSKYNTTTLCESSRVAVEATIKSVPIAPTTVGNSRCDAGTVALSVSSVADAFNWYVDGSTNTILSTGSSFITPSINNTTTYYVEAVTDGCKSSRASVVATIYTTPNNPFTTGGVICGHGTVLLSASAVGTATLNWYADPSTSTISHIGTSYTTTDISVDTIYYISATEHGCTSARASVIAKVNTIPSLPVGIDNSKCGNGQVNISATGAGTGEDYKWYDAITGGLLKQTNGNLYQTPSLTSTTNFYVSKYNTTTLCESFRVPVVATIKAIPSAPVTVGDSRCDAGIVSLSVSSVADAFNWYIDGSTSTVLSTGSSYITPSISSSKTYYVDAVINGCTSATRSTVTATINTTPAVPTPTPGTRCDAGTVPLLVSGTGTFQWYATPSILTISHTGATYTTSVISSDTTYYVSATQNGCTSARAIIVATVNHTPQIISTTPGASCGTGTVAVPVTLSAIATDGTLQWFNSANTLSGTGNSIAPSIFASETFSVKATQNGCTSLPTTVQATVNLIPSPTIGTIPDNYNVKDTASYQLVGNPLNGIFSGNGVIGSTKKFYPSIAGLSPAAGFDILYTYTTPQGCSNVATKTVFVLNDIATFNSDLKAVYCHNEAPSTFTVNFGAFTHTQDSIIFFNENGIRERSEAYSISVIIDPKTFKVGKHQVRCKYLTTASFSIDKFFEIDSIPQVSIDNLSTSYCVYNSPVRLQAVNTGTGGTNKWSLSNGTPISGNNNFYDLDPSSFTPNSYSISYYYITANLCPSNTVTKPFVINPRPVLEILSDTLYNLAQGAVNLKGKGDGVSAGVFTGSGVNEIKRDTLYQFLPATAGVQNDIPITYTYTNPTTTCVNTSTAKFDVVQATDTIQGINRVFCYKDNDQVFSISNKHNLVGSFRLAKKPSALTNSGNNTAIFHPSAFVWGADTVIYSYSYRGVYFEVRKAFSVDSVSTAVNFTAPNAKFNYCEYDLAIQLEAKNLFPDPTKGFGTWIGPSGLLSPVNNIATLDPSKAVKDTNIVRYLYTSQGGCRSDTVTKIFYIYKKPSVSIVGLTDNYNVDVNQIPLQGVPSTGGTGKFEGPGVVSGVLYTSIAGVRNDVPISYQFTDAITLCTNTAYDTINILKANAHFDGLADNYCYTDVVDTITGVAVGGSSTDTIIGPGITFIQNSKAVFSPKEAGAGDKVITYKYLGNDGYTWFSIDKTIHVDSIGQLDIVDLASEYCSNSTRQLIRAIAPNSGTYNFYGPSGFHDQGQNAFFYTDSIGIFETYIPVKFVYQSPLHCLKEVRDSFVIHKTPLVSFTVQNNGCFGSGKNSSASVFKNSSFYNPSDILTWKWNFGDNSSLANESSDFEPVHTYTGGGQKTVSLVAETDKGCKATSFSRTFIIDDLPLVKFSWNNECFMEGQAVQFTNMSTIVSDTAYYKWSFYGNNTVQSTNLYNTSKTYNTPGDYEVKLVVTTQTGCKDSLSSILHLRPTYRLATAAYHENFEGTQQFWIDTASNNSNRWIWGAPANTAASYAASGTKMIYTSIADPGQKSQLALVGPCFDFSGTKRPIISIQTWKAFELNRDGVVLQYSKDNAATWTTVGIKDDGINWYNSNHILGTPANSVEGWTASADDKFDSTWYDARHSLDELKGATSVRFRFVYGSNGTTLSSKGFALDSIWIGERERNTLIEHFGNNTSAAIAAEAQLDGVLTSSASDFIDIRYHLGNDPLYTTYSAGPTVRSMLYKLSKVPLSVVSGGNDVTSVDYVSQVWNDDSKRNLMIETLYEPAFDLAINSSIENGTLQANVKVTYRKTTSLPASKKILYLAVVEPDVVENGVTYKNVLRNLLPDASGTIFETAWVKGQSSEVNLSGDLSNVTDKSKLKVVAFIQDDATKEIYQSVSDTLKSVATGISPSVAGIADITVYPNPASEKCFISFKAKSINPSKVDIIDQNGSVVFTQPFAAGTTNATLPLTSVKNGVYVMRITSGSSIIYMQKLVVFK
jgi:hypothetical protein